MPKGRELQVVLRMKVPGEPGADSVPTLRPSVQGHVATHSKRRHWRNRARAVAGVLSVSSKDSERRNDEPRN